MGATLKRDTKGEEMKSIMKALAQQETHHKRIYPHQSGKSSIPGEDHNHSAGWSKHTYIDNRFGVTSTDPFEEDEEEQDRHEDGLG